MSVNILNGTDEFPYPNSINREDFQDFKKEEIDAYLFKNHRFSSIDSLIKELEALSQSLNQELVDLINSEYNDFIKLGKSINGGLELINMIRLNVNNFKKVLITTSESLEESYNQTDYKLQKRRELNDLKQTIKLCILLNSQIANFENILKVDSQSGLNLQNLMSLYLSMLKLFSILNIEKNKDNIYINKLLSSKIASLKLEFKSYLDTVLKIANKDRKDKASELLDLMSIYKIMGHEADFISIMKSKN